MDLLRHGAKNTAPAFSSCSRRETSPGVNCALTQRKHSLSITLSVITPLTDYCLQSSVLWWEKAALTSVSNSKQVWARFCVKTRAEVTSEVRPFTTKPIHVLCSPGHANVCLTSLPWKGSWEGAHVQLGSAPGFMFSPKESDRICLGSCCLFYFILKTLWEITLTSPLSLSLILLVVLVLERCWKSTQVLILQSSTGNCVHSYATVSQAVNRCT